MGKVAELFVVLQLYFSAVDLLLEFFYGVIGRSVMVIYWRSFEVQLCGGEVSEEKQESCWYDLIHRIMLFQ